MIGEALPFCGTNSGNGAGFVIEAQRLTMVIAEVEFCKVAMQMLFAAMLIHAAHAAFEDQKVDFG